ncbi:cell cycle control protein 50A isoform X2 [Gracilinanus agilis]|uniref:cell cycle control protein 50A isoform X2 n=1 Tax=Gracilinanus agilis TaxID=191870 RepID=UPI001CFE0851|nr:cell cycle control protein 50A isoform X2 [Gracilinanus agilis]
MAINYNAKDEVDGGHGSNLVMGGHSGTGNAIGGGGPKSRRPDNTAFKQQRLPAWQPILTAGTVLPAFFVVGLIFIPIGIGVFVTSNNIREFEGHVFMYYGLSNFYQNHRRYVKSRDDSQLNGDITALRNPSKECEPYRRDEDIPIAPCGAIANSMFNDTLELFQMNGTTPIPIALHKKGIAWWTDKNVKFRNPPGENLTETFAGTAKPRNWPKPVYMLDKDEENNGFINEDFIVWMRTAALPTFRKLYRLIERKNGLHPTLPVGQYLLKITYNYPVHTFDGRKRMILSTISWMGGKNPFLGIAYITVGSICFLFGVVLLVIHHKYGNRNNSADIPN